MIRPALALLLTLAPALAEDGHVATLGGLDAIHAWSRATTGDTAFVFVELRNDGDAPMTLIGGQTEVAEQVELVGFSNAGGQPGYVAMPMLPVAPGTEMDLAPEGAALRLGGLTGPLDVDAHFDLTLVFEEGTLAITVEVEPATATQSRHAGHAH